MSKVSESRIAENILLFCRTLRNAGLPIGPGQVLDASEAILRTGIARRDDFYMALRAVLVTDPMQFRLFEQAFHVYFRNPRLLERMIGLLLPTFEQHDRGAGSSIRRLLEAMSNNVIKDEEDVIDEVNQVGSSPHEVLRNKDFDQMSLEECNEAKQMLRERINLIQEVPTRRFCTDYYGCRYDLRKSMQRMLRTDGQLIQLVRKQRRLRAPTLVLICDISGSMSQYSRMFMYFAHTLTNTRQKVHTFVLGTRLTNITHWLISRDVDRALDRVTNEVQDWDGGTRIADCLARFNADWGRRILSSSSVVVLLSDGLERDSTSDLGFQMSRLQRNTNQLIWLNPMLRYSEFEAKAFGIRTMLPYVDRFLPAHNVTSLIELGRLLSSSHYRSEREAA